jgi:hypothetical protein
MGNVEFDKREIADAREAKLKDLLNLDHVDPNGNVHQLIGDISDKVKAQGLDRKNQMIADMNGEQK